MQVENAPLRPSTTQEARKMDLELAVLMQELMSLREDKVELLAKLFALEKDKSAIELKLKYVEGQQKAQGAAFKNLQGQLKDTEALLALATQNKVMWEKLRFFMQKRILNSWCSYFPFWLYYHENQYVFFAVFVSNCVKTTC